MSIKLGDVEAEAGINKRQDTASSYYPEEWPEEFICHGTNGGIFNEVSQRFAFIRTDRGLNFLVLDLLLPRKEDRLVSGSKVKTTFSIETLG